MKVVIENMIASCKLSGNIDLQAIAGKVEGATYKASTFKGVILKNEDPKADIFILGDGTMKLHGLTSEEKLRNVMSSTLTMLKEKGIPLSVSGPLRINEIVASFTMDSRIDPKEVYEEFKDDGVIYDPSELPGFILRVGTSGIEVLIFPEGKVISRGAQNLMDAISSLQMVESRINRKR